MGPILGAGIPGDMIRVRKNESAEFAEWWYHVLRCHFMAPVDVQELVDGEVEELHLDEDDADALWCWAETLDGWQEGCGVLSTAWIRDDLDDFAVATKVSR
jgi:hypothetical protein